MIVQVHYSVIRSCQALNLVREVDSYGQEDPTISDHHWLTEPELEYIIPYSRYPVKTPVSALDA